MELPGRRGHGYARRPVREMTGAAPLRPDVQACTRFADVANHVSNSIYRQAGYRAVAEHVEVRLT